MSSDSANLRRGYTTGACATAATRAALLGLLHGERPAAVTIDLPIGEQATFPVDQLTVHPETAEAAVTKDAGDDPDATHQAQLRSHVRIIEEPGVRFEQGEGVGRVTRPGLPVAVGEPAINPVPRQMIEKAVRMLLAETAEARGVAVRISVPGGAKIAGQTLNPRLGIEGGISILGTSGIVEPYSTAAWEASVTQNIDVAVAQGLDELAFTVGGRGERLAKGWVSLPEVAYIQLGPFFGKAFRHAAALEISRVSLIAMIGKLAKFAAGHESVHSGQSDQDFAFLAALAEEAGAGSSLVERIGRANTAQEAAELAEAEGLNAFFDLLSRRARDAADRLTAGRITTEVRLLASDGRPLGYA